MPSTEPLRCIELYRESKDRAVGLLDDGDDAAWDAPVATCPAWSVRDVVAHVVAVAEEFADGRLTGPPTDAQTAAQVARFGTHTPGELLAAWDAATDELDRMARTRGLVAPVGDVVSHEHDIRTALGRAGARDSAAVHFACDQLMAILNTPVPLRVRVEDREYRAGPADGDALLLHTSRFEALRWRTGRRSRAQLAAMDWSADPAPVLDTLYLFGPAASDIIE